MNLIALDIETTGLDWQTDTIHGVGLASEQGAAYVEPSDPRLAALLADPTAHIVGHNIRFDLKFLLQVGLKIQASFWDTKLLAQLDNENQELGLKPLSKKYFGSGSLEQKDEIDLAVLAINGKSVADLCIADLKDPAKPYYELIEKYCLEDCQNTLKLFRVLRESIAAKHEAMLAAGFKETVQSYYLQETMPLEKVLLAMEMQGIHLDKDSLNDYNTELSQQIYDKDQNLEFLCSTEINQIEEEMYEEAKTKKKSEKGQAAVIRSSEKYGTKFNWQSSQHLASLLFDKLGVPENMVEKTATGKPSTSESSLADVCKAEKEGTKIHSILTLFGALKKDQKIYNMYVNPCKGLASMSKWDRIYSEYLQAGRGKEESEGGTVTGRLSSRNPNMQNLPRGSRVKQMFVPNSKNNIFAYFDYSQLELRIAAHVSQDPLLLKAYTDGLDLHNITAAKLGIDRQAAKAVNFAMIYDASAYRLSEMIDKSYDETQDVIDGFFQMYSGYKKYLQNQRHFMIKNRCVVSEAGRVRRLPELGQYSEGQREHKHAIKQGYNFPIQSLGASIAKRAMIELHRRGFVIATQVHDSVVIDLPLLGSLEKLEEIRQVAENIYPLSVPLKVDIKRLTTLLETDIVIDELGKTIPFQKENYAKQQCNSITNSQSNSGSRHSLG